MSASWSVLMLRALPSLAAAVREAAPGATVHQLDTVGEIERCLRDPPADGWSVVFVPGGDPSDWSAVRALGQADPQVPVVAVAPRGDVGLAAAAISAGAHDFLVLGADLVRRVRTTLDKLGPVHHLRRENAGLRAAVADWSLVGRSRSMEALRTQIGRVARVPRPVLIRGERGTGKELVARAIHAAAGPPSRPWVAVNCAAFADALLESELFGHERGAFTGADRRSQGRFEQASGGTLFLDEIAATPVSFQQKVLRAVEYGEYRRVGGADDLRSTARIIAATNADLERSMADGRFLPDLYDRLAFEVIVVAPLRDRPEDIATLASLFLDRFAREVPALYGKRLTDEAVLVLQRSPFPGNVRELKHVVERAAYRSAGDAIGVEDLGLSTDTAVDGTFDAAVERFQRMLLADALRRANDNHAAAARALGMSYHSFRYYAKRLLGG
jgi:DNA-binding NtrC family response regulator